MAAYDPVGAQVSLLSDLRGSSLLRPIRILDFHREQHDTMYLGFLTLDLGSSAGFRSGIVSPASGRLLSQRVLELERSDEPAAHSRTTEGLKRSPVTRPLHPPDATRFPAGQHRQPARRGLPLVGVLFALQTGDGRGQPSRHEGVAL